MQLLLDTTVFLWAVTDDGRLTDPARALIGAAQVVYVSSASFWEASARMHAGQLTLDLQELDGAVAASGFTDLPVTAAHVTRAHAFPLDLRDAFARLLLAQAVTEPARLVTATRAWLPYSPLVLPVEDVK